MSLELGVENGSTFLSSAHVSNGEIDVYLGHDGTVVESDGEGVSDESLGRVVVLLGDLLVLDANNLREIIPSVVRSCDCTEGRRRLTLARRASIRGSAATSSE